MLAAVPAGLVAGAFFWLVFSHGAAAAAHVGALEARAHSLALGTTGGAGGQAGGSALASPIFIMTTGPRAVTETIVVLIGLQRTPSRSAALISINGKPADWLELGATRDDVTLAAVQSASVTVDTPTELKEVALGAKPTPGAGQSGGGASSPNTVPQGVRLPPPPASAP